MKTFPKFTIINSCSGEREFIFHSQPPLMLCEVKYLDGGTIDIQPVWSESFEDADVMRAAGLMRRMGDWYYNLKKGE